ncbi:MAG: proline dehydrogenase family protein [Actinomycetota bacterium]|nr:proline dehydrogenase family protein [Actinomycetota bacterium]
MRVSLLAFADRPVVRKLATSGVGRKVALRFVAGEHLDDGLRAVKALNERGTTASLDHLGENVTDEPKATEAARVYIETVERIESAGLLANISVKLSQLGLDIDPDLALGNAERVVERAAAAGTTVTLDMEDHRYTERTVAACQALAERHPGAIGVALQSYLYRTPEDLERVIHTQVRLCKGAYLESADVAYPHRNDVDKAFAHLARRLLQAGTYPMIATHDEQLVRFVQRTAERVGRDRSTFEFQMLYGIRRDLQRALVDDGYRVRIYVPFGTEWYPYLVRRLAERPANIRFFASQLFRR